MGNPPVVVSPKTNQELIATLKNVLLTMHMYDRGEASVFLILSTFSRSDFVLFIRLAILPECIIVLRNEMR